MLPRAGGNIHDDLLTIGSDKCYKDNNKKLGEFSQEMQAGRVDEALLRDFGEFRIGE